MPRTPLTDAAPEAAAPDTRELLTYDAPDGVWGDHTVEITLQLGRARTIKSVKVGGNSCGLDVLRSAVSVLHQDFIDSVCDSDPLTIAMQDRDGREYTHDIYDEQDLEKIVVGMRFVSFTEDP